MDSMIQWFFVDISLSEKLDKVELLFLYFSMIPVCVFWPNVFHWGQRSDVTLCYETIVENCLEIAV